MANDSMGPKNADNNDESFDEAKFLALLEKKGLRATAEVYRNELRGASNSSSTPGSSGEFVSSIPSYVFR